MARFLNVVANFLVIFFIFFLVFETYEVARSKDCPPDNWRDWFRVDKSWFPCDPLDDGHAVMCGKICREKDADNVGACVESICMCCTKDPYDWFLSTGYKKPCDDGNNNHILACYQDCKKQGADDGACFGGVCECTTFITSSDSEDPIATPANEDMIATLPPGEE